MRGVALGQIYLTLDSELNREVALKELRPERADDPDNRTRFLLEAEVIGRLEHPGVVPVCGLGSDAQGRPFYAMRFVRGRNLKEAIHRFHEDEKSDGSDSRPWNLSLRQLLNRFVAVCNVLAYAQRRNVDDGLGPGQSRRPRRASRPFWRSRGDLAAELGFE